MGVAREFCAENEGHHETAIQLEWVQSRLLDVGSAVATPSGSSSERKLQRVQFGVEHVNVVEVCWLMG